MFSSLSNLDELGRWFYYCCHDRKHNRCPVIEYEGSVYGKEEKLARWWGVMELNARFQNGELVFRLIRKVRFLTRVSVHHLTQIYTGWMERLHAADWTLDPAVATDKKGVLPTRGREEHLAESWEFTPYTMWSICIKELAGRIYACVRPEFTGDDVAFDFHRLYGLAAAIPYPARPGLK